MNKQRGEKIEPRATQFFKVIGIVLVVAAFTLLLEHLGWLRGFERSAMDTWLRVRLPLTQPAESKHVVIIGITNKDYKEIFSSKRPLDRGALEQIIKAIITAKPAVLGVDIDTSNETFKEMSLPTEVPIVWAEDAPPAEAETPSEEVFSALGGRKLDLQATGIAQLPMENDGIVRTYTREIRGRDSFQWAVTRAFCVRLREDMEVKAHLAPEYPTLARRCEEVDRIHNNEEKKGELVIDFLGDRYNFQHYSAREVLDAYSEGRQDFLNQFSGKIVLLGGLFSSARDEYTTPVGRMAGVELMAHAIESELQGGGFRRPKQTFMIVFSLVGGTVILLLFIRYGLTKGCLLSIISIIVIAPIWSFLAFHSFAYTIYFLPILFAVLIHQLYEQAHYYQHLWFHNLPQQTATESTPGTVPAGTGKEGEAQPEP